MNIKPILPVDVVRDEDGWFTHPQYLTEPEWEGVECMTNAEFDKYMSDRGIVAAITSLEGDDSEMHERYCEECQVDCTAWTPSRPAGDGWFMLSIHDTEDGPICVWGRRTEEPFVTEVVAATSEPDLFSEQPAQPEPGSALQSLANFTEHSFAQLMRYEDGRTPLYLTEEQYNAIRDLVAKASSKPELFAVHAQGPDEIYPAYDQADAERHAAELNALRTPPGISVSAVVIPSPFTELEHWKCFAEQEHEHKLHLLAGVAPTDANLSAMRREGLSIDGDNAYKRDLIDSIVGALAFGKQGVNPPPAGHWGKQFWDIGRAEGEEKERLINQRDAVLLQARVWAGEAKTQQAITREVGEILGGVPNWGPIAAGVEALRQRVAAFELMREHRIAVTPEHEGQWHADLYGEESEPLVKAEGETPEAAVHAVIAAHRAQQGE